MALAIPPASGPAHHSSTSGMIMAAAAFALLTAVDILFKLMALSHHPAYQILFINGCFALVPTIIWVMVTGGFGQLRTARLGQHMARGAASVFSAFAAIFAYSRLPLTSFYAIVFMGPLVVTLMSIFWLGEKIDRDRGIAIVIGFSGIMIVTHFFGGNSNADSMAITVGRFAAVLSVFGYALSVVAIRRMRLGESNMAFSFYGYVTAILIGGILYFLRGAPQLHLADVVHLAISGSLAGVASICLITAYHRTPVALVAPFQYSQIIWGAIAGFLIWKHVPDLNLVVGAFVVAASGFFIIYREMCPRESR